MSETVTLNSHKQTQVHEKIAEETTAETLQESDAILHSFYDSAPMMMGVVDILDNDILHLSDNAATTQFMGVTPGTTQRKLASELGMPQTYIEEWLQSLSRVRAYPGSCSIPLPPSHIAGSTLALCNCLLYCYHRGRAFPLLVHCRGCHGTEAFCRPSASTIRGIER